MAVLPFETLAQNGLDPTYTAAGGSGDLFPNDGGTFLRVNNAGGAPITVTINATRACNFGQMHNAVVSVPNGDDRIIGPFPPAAFNNADGQVAVSYSAVTSVTVGVFRLRNAN